MHITKEKKDAIRQYYINGQLCIPNIAEQLGLGKATVRYHLNKLRTLALLEPEKLPDSTYFLGKEGVTRPSAMYRELERLLPRLIAREKGPVIVAANIYRGYHALSPGGYSAPRFYYLFKRWFDKHCAALSAKRLTEKYTPAELATLKRWRNANDHRLWQVAVMLMTVYTYHSLNDLADRIGCTRKTLRTWRRAYETGGLEAVSRPGDKRPLTEEKQNAIEKKMDELVHLVRQSPKTYGIGSTSWKIADLAYVFGKLHGSSISYSQVSIYLKKRGIRYRRSREVLVSNDPQFGEKFSKLQNTLKNLGPKERFFSIDEYGPKAVRPRGGYLLAAKGEIPVYQKVDRSRGWFICTCALELSTNQLTWFYSRKKDTGEMIKLIDVLTEEYQHQERLYLSWDAASWHDSHQLKDYLEEINEPGYRAKLKTPEIIIVPLPAKAPHLNVIESVFSGMAKSVIHNSDYDTVGDCTAAIDRYFNRRNAHFKQNPKQAGEKIWGREKVKPVFNKANICRNIG